MSTFIGGDIKIAVIGADLDAAIQQAVGAGAEALHVVKDDRLAACASVGARAAHRFGGGSGCKPRRSARLAARSGRIASRRDA